jgi:hypothetical protein
MARKSSEKRAQKALRRGGHQAEKRERQRIGRAVPDQGRRGGLRAGQQGSWFKALHQANGLRAQERAGREKTQGHEKAHPAPTPTPARRPLCEGEDPALQAPVHVQPDGHDSQGRGADPLPLQQQDLGQGGLSGQDGLRGGQIPSGGAVAPPPPNPVHPKTHANAGPTPTPKPRRSLRSIKSSRRATRRRCQKAADPA